MDEEADVPFYRRPLPPIQRPAPSVRSTWPPNSVSMTVDENPAPSKSLENIEPPRANGDAPPHDDAANTTLEAIPVPEDAAAFTARLSSVSNATAPVPVDEVEVRLLDPLAALAAAAHAVDLARVHARECRATVLASRDVFSKALEAWNRTQPIQTQEQALRDYVNTSQMERARKAAAGQGVSYPGITRTAKAMAGGNAKQGGGASYRRGALPRAQAMELEAGKLRAAAAAVKPQGQR
jgi:hypothetical protein